MYLRIMNKLDVDALEIGNIIDEVIMNRIRELITTLDEAYGMHRGSNDMGGYVLFFKDENSYNSAFDLIMDFYNLEENMYEYSDCINQEKNMKWMEELYMLGSDDALVLIHPKNEEV